MNTLSNIQLIDIIDILTSKKSKAYNHQIGKKYIILSLELGKPLVLRYSNYTHLQTKSVEAITNYADKLEIRTTDSIYILEKLNGGILNG